MSELLEKGLIYAEIDTGMQQTTNNTTEQAMLGDFDGGALLEVGKIDECSSFELSLSI